jgi:hypothetical protein
VKFVFNYIHNKIGNHIVHCFGDYYEMKRFLVPFKPVCKPQYSEKGENAQSSGEPIAKRFRYNASSSENTGNQSSDGENNKEVEHNPREAVKKNDVGNFISVRLSESQRLDLLTNVWVPPKNYAFPLLQKFEARKLRFCHKWLDEFSWIAYSELHQGAFCVPCVAFAKSGGKGSQPLGHLVKTKFDNWKKAKQVSI